MLLRQSFSFELQFAHLERVALNIGKCSGAVVKETLRRLEGGPLVVPRTRLLEDNKRLMATE
jgi:hypothetical protein